MSKTSFVQRSIIQMQSRSGNKCHLQCPQQANAIAKPNLRRYLALWSTAPPRCAPRRTCRALCAAAQTLIAAPRAADASRPARNFVRITTWSPVKIGVYAPAFVAEIDRVCSPIESSDSIQIIKNMKLSFWEGCK